MDYKSSGVDIDAGNEAVRRIRGLARSTFTSGGLSDIGSFGGLFQLESGRYELVLRPLDSRISYRTASVREVLTVWRRA